MANDVTLDDVARRSGVSPATASRALNGRRGVRDDVRERVLSTASSLKYRPNRAAQNLAGGRTSVIGLVLGSEELVGNTYATSIVQSVAAAASVHDEGLMLILDSQKPAIAVQNLLSDGLVDGVIISVVAIGEQWVEELLDANIPTVLLGAHPRRTDVPVVDVDNLTAGHLLTAEVLRHGHRRVAMLAGPQSRVDANQRLRGFRAAHEELGLAVDESLIFPGDFHGQTAYQRAPEIFAAAPDAIVACNDDMAIGLLRYANEHGIDVPTDVSIVGFDGITLRYPEYQITTMAQPFERLGRTAVASLLDLIRGDSVPPEQLLGPQLIERGSIGSPPET